MAPAWILCSNLICSREEDPLANQGEYDLSRIREMITLKDILKARILIVDTQPEGITELEAMMHDAGYTAVSSTPNPQEVCELHRDNRYSLVLLDLQMPGMDAVLVMDGLKALEADCHLPVLAIVSQPGQKLRALKAGAKDFVSKPYDRTDLLMRVHHLLEIRLLCLETLLQKEQAEERFIEAQKMEMIGQLAGGVAHDFNNILAVIMGYNELIMSSLSPEIPQRKYAEEIRCASERAAGLTQQLLGFDLEQPSESALPDLNAVVKVYPVARPNRFAPWPRGTETVLVVEDDPSVRDLAHHVLNCQGYEVLTALNGQDALHVVHEHKGERIRLVFTDVVMPLMGGKVMSEWLRTTLPDLKILFTSGYTERVIGRHGVLGAGAEFLPKPYTPHMLSSKVRELLDKECL